jgi:hypothetical protein
MTASLLAFANMEQRAASPVLSRIRQRYNNSRALEINDQQRASFWKLPSGRESPANEDPKYTKLVNLKKLLDGGVITQEEFDREKSKILNQP